MVLLFSACRPDAPAAREPSTATNSPKADLEALFTPHGTAWFMGLYPGMVCADAVLACHSPLQDPCQTGTAQCPLAPSEQFTATLSLHFKRGKLSTFTVYLQPQEVNDETLFERLCDGFNNRFGTSPAADGFAQWRSDTEHGCLEVVALRAIDHNQNHYLSVTFYPCGQ